MTQVNRAVAHRIRIELARQDKSVTQLATESDIKSKTLYKRLHRIRPTSFQPAELMRVARVLSLDITDLLADDDEPNGGEAA